MGTHLGQAQVEPRLWNMRTAQVSTRMKGESCHLPEPYRVMEYEMGHEAWDREQGCEVMVLYC